MRMLVCLSGVAALAGWNTVVCMGQQTSGPATLENLLNHPGHQRASVVTEAAGSGPKQPAGALTRPKDSFQHPALDKAWAEYDAAAMKAAAGIKAALGKQFDAAASKGDLDAAEKWQAALEKFEQAGEVPADAEVKAAVTAATTASKKATDQLAKAYEAVVKSLTMDRNIAEAKLVRDEFLAINDDLGQGAVRSTGRAAKVWEPVVELRIDSRRGWQPVVEVEQGDRLRIAATGEWCRGISAAGQLQGNRYSEDPMPAAPHGSLIGRVGSHVFVVGVESEFESTARGKLELRINDADSWLDDNYGSLSVAVQRKR